MKIPAVVTCVHLLLLAGLLYLHVPEAKPKVRGPVHVQTYVVQEDRPKPVEVAKPAVAAKAKPVAQPKPEPVVKKSDPNRERLMHLMKQSLDSFESSSSAAPVVVKKEIGALASEALNFEISYQEQLVAFLERALTLPEKGDVKLALTLNRTGGVKEVRVEKSASERNRSYVEATVPSLLLPPFESHFKGESAHRFSITLTSS